jgi:hypothetical protein
MLKKEIENIFTLGTFKLFFVYIFLHLFFWRLWRTGMLLLTKLEGHKSNFHYSEFPNHPQTKSSLNISICQSKLKRKCLPCDTLYKESWPYCEFHYRNFSKHSKNIWLMLSLGIFLYFWSKNHSNEWNNPKIAAMKELSKKSKGKIWLMQLFPWPFHRLKSRIRQGHSISLTFKLQNPSDNKIVQNKNNNNI